MSAADNADQSQSQSHAQGHPAQDDQGQSQGQGQAEPVPERRLVLLSKDGHRFETTAALVAGAQTIEHALEDAMADDDDAPTIPMPEVAAREAARILEFCGKRAALRDRGAEWEAWTRSFLVDLSTEELYDLTMAGNYLGFPPVLDACCGRIADMIKGKTVEEIRETFGIVNDFTPEEEARVRKDHEWAFDAPETTEATA